MHKLTLHTSFLWQALQNYSYTACFSTLTGLGNTGGCVHDCALAVHQFYTKHVWFMWLIATLILKKKRSIAAALSKLYHSPACLHSGVKPNCLIWNGKQTSYSARQDYFSLHTRLFGDAYVVLSLYASYMPAHAFPSLPELPLCSASKQKYPPSFWACWPWAPSLPSTICSESVPSDACHVLSEHWHLQGAVCSVKALCGMTPALQMAPWLQKEWIRHRRESGVVGVEPVTIGSLSGGKDCLGKGS